MGIELRLLTYFVEVADAGSVSAAAGRLHVTQPALSRQIHVLERQLDMSLFEREGRRLVLTRAGDQFLPTARDLLLRAAAARRTADLIARGRLDRVRLALPTTTLTDIVAPFIATFRESDPTPIVHELDPRTAEAAIDAGADLAIIARTPATTVESILLAEPPVVAYVRADDPWAGRRDVPLEELVSRPIALMTRDFSSRAQWDAAVELAGSPPAELIECTHAQVAQALSAAGRAIAVVSDAPRFGLVGLRIRAGSHELKVRIHAAWDPGHHARDVLADLAERLREFCSDLYRS